MTFPKPELVISGEKYIVGLSRDFTIATRGDIPALWNELFKSDAVITNEVHGALFGVSYAMTSTGGFKYLAGAQVTQPQNVAPPFCTLTLAPGPYMVFRARGPMSGLPALFDHVFSDWLPTSDFVQRQGPVFERYPNDPRGGSDRAYEIWCPVTKPSPPAPT